MRYTETGLANRRRTALAQACQPFTQRNKIKILLRCVGHAAWSFYNKASGSIRQVLGKLSTKFRSRHPRDDEWA